MMDPYAVLGVPENATDIEIKRAYRRLVKKYHPDLKPDDKAAADKMHEINEAYDRLMHPEKYAFGRRRNKSQHKEDAHKNSDKQEKYTRKTEKSESAKSTEASEDAQSAESAGAADSAKKAQSDDSTGKAKQDDSSETAKNYRYEQNREYNREQPPVDDMHPEIRLGDSKSVKSAINSINTGMHSDAMQSLMKVSHSNRDARWYYLYAIALYGYGDIHTAVNYIVRAVKMDADNIVYRRLYHKYSEDEQTYYKKAAVGSPIGRVGRFVLMFVIVQLIAILWALN